MTPGGCGSLDPLRVRHIDFYQTTMMARMARRMLRRDLQRSTSQTIATHCKHSTDAARQQWLKGLDAILNEQDGNADNSPLQTDMLQAGVPLAAESPSNPKRLTAAVIGVPNVGKSTLINRILDHNVRPA